MPDNVYNGELAGVYQFKFCLQNTSYWAIPDVNSIVEVLGEGLQADLPRETHA